MHPVVIDTIVDSKQRLDWGVSMWQCFMTLKSGKLCSHIPQQYMPADPTAPMSAAYMLHFCPCHML